MNSDDKDKLHEFFKEHSFDFEKTYSEFAETVAAEKSAATGHSPAAFLKFLQDKKVIVPQDVASALASTGVDVTGEAGASALLESMRYDMLHMLDEGAMGTIMVAKDRDLRRRVAIKKLKQQFMSSPVMKRFITEAQVTAQLDHPNIIPIYSLEIDPDGNISFAMKLIHGKTLQDYVDEVKASYSGRKCVCMDKKYWLANRLEIMLRICDAMSYAHSRGVIHRDLKPANVMLGEFREVYVMDWGVSRMMKGEPEADYETVEVATDLDARMIGQTAVGQVVGTPRYMSPEQARGLNHKLDQRSDLYSLGLILYELATCKSAYGKVQTLEEMLDKVRRADVEPVEHVFPKVKIPAEIAAIIRKAVSGNPEDRYDSVQDFADDLRRFLRNEETVARPDDILHKGMRWMARHRALALSLVMTAVTLSALVDSWVLYRQKMAIQASRAREAKLTRFQAAVGRQAHLIDLEIIQYENCIRMAAEVVAHQLIVGDQSDMRVFSADDLKTVDQGPADAAYSKSYGERISAEHASYKLAPGLSQDAAAPVLARLVPATHALRDAVLKSSGKGYDPETAKIDMATEGLPVRWAYVGLANGLFFCYPGAGDYPEDYDPRTRPWYISATQEVHSVWSDPYIDMENREAVLSCAQAIRGEEEELLGVVALDLTFRAIIQSLLSPEERPFWSACIVDEQGHVIVCTDDVKEKKYLTALQRMDTLPLLPHEEVVTAIRGRQFGQVEVRENGQSVVVAYQSIPTLGWYYVEKVSLDRLLASPVSDLGWLFGREVE